MNRKIVFLLVLATLGARCVGCGRSPAQVPAPAPAAKIPSLPAKPATPTALVEANFDDLKFEIEADADFEKSMLTPKVNELFDRRIRIRGYILPTLKKKGLKQFVLLRDNLECCFGPGAALYDCILVHMKDGKTAEFSIRPVAVEGTLKFEEFLDYDGTTRAIFRLDGESVE